MSETANLGLPYIEGSQAQKHVTHNEALRILDAAIQVAVLDRTRTSPPSSPVDGQRHIVATSPSGAWTGHAKAIATWQDNAWAFLNPKIGWCVWSVADAVLYVFDGAQWRDLRDLPVSLDNAARIGVNTTAASPNLLSVKSNAALLGAINTADGGSGDARLQISKESAAKTASVFFSDAFSGRAEFGLVGDDDFRLKVSANGTTWTDALRVDRSTGRVTFPSGGGARDVLTANRTYYVRSDGSDSNTGLANTAGGAYLTIQKAVDVVATLDIAGFQVTVQIADGTYTGTIVLKNVVGFAGPGSLVIQGNAGTPSNVLVSVTSADAITADAISTVWDIKDLKITVSGSGNGISARNGASVRFGNLNFGAVAGTHVNAMAAGRFVILSSYTISGSASVHWLASYGSAINVTAGITITLSGTPAFSGIAFVVVGFSSIAAFGLTFSGAATGVRYSAQNNGLIFTNSGGANYFPGNAAGSAINGGLYL